MNTKFCEHEHHNHGPCVATREGITLIGITHHSAVHNLCTVCGQPCGRTTYDAGAVDRGARLIMTTVVEVF